ncbi:MAG: DUF3306 domain-containing protein [Candidatus Thiodiazotropha lotti]|nr:DUF3306 domain-containing protein [Candidatus Thiodiazotropha lotti]ODB99791.1 hypothetical protein A3197_12870 [Candidatus Thiodiazotropha endoloripes]MCG7921457.1 DUF3306 domain-containing protein [Candidatus Thiodiazotropha lotti]MCG7931695.1 DUF3306 domain-containing protein [Candidatus Thiodiazotropha lotti]MCG7985774.1 DUF3306 domain-containing protein [Candidatus Thiodiazotropha lotti]
MERDEKKPLNELRNSRDENFIRRWSDRKLASQQPLVEQAEAEQPLEQPCDEDMPPLESLNDSSDYSGFLSPKVSEPLRKIALRKLFHGSDFNLCDGLDDYAEDFTKFEALGDVITADLKHQLEVQEQKEVEQQALAEAEPGESATAAVESKDETSAEDPHPPTDQQPSDDDGNDNRETPA